MHLAHHRERPYSSRMLTRLARQLAEGAGAQAAHGTVRALCLAAAGLPAIWPGSPNDRLLIVGLSAWWPEPDTEGARKEALNCRDEESQAGETIGSMLHPSSLPPSVSFRWGRGLKAGENGRSPSVRTVVCFRAAFDVSAAWRRGRRQAVGDGGDRVGEEVKGWMGILDGTEIKVVGRERVNIAIAGIGTTLMSHVDGLRVRGLKVVPKKDAQSR
ncbi:hypothetical protein EJ06DRAFT_528649 [Trichodelitschia bisporula]|uniref:Uncharacterized protein n=1 Tax=Trichodelitschia bisporula TaxID=703511 RepID=A0A6G1I391_9PEZI|nr:hypothetical protein EJ06DRAFT_528649 [Trichodelitschia bisporula]